MQFEHAKTKQVTAELAAERIFIATSLWKYEGWFGEIYTPSRYDYRGKVANTHFERKRVDEHLIFKDCISLLKVCL